MLETLQPVLKTQAHHYFRLHVKSIHGVAAALYSNAAPMK